MTAENVGFYRDYYFLFAKLLLCQKKENLHEKRHDGKDGVHEETKH
jgi:hypothetical protein